MKCSMEVPYCNNKATVVCTWVANPEPKEVYYCEEHFMIKRQTSPHHMEKIRSYFEYSEDDFWKELNS